MGSILFLAKHKPFADDAAELLKLHFPNAEIVFGNLKEAFPEHLRQKQFKYVISYISPWIVPPDVLANATCAAINLHPGPPEYPGIGCTNFAIYDGVKEFGITVHHMKEKVDSGDIILVERFPIFSNDSVYTLSQRCYAYIFIAFIKLLPAIIDNRPFPTSDERWQRNPYTRKQLNALCRLTSNMPREEVERRIRATTYPGMPGVCIERGGKEIPIQSYEEYRSFIAI